MIPKIHWLYVQAYPVEKGAPAIAEMLTKMLCRLQGIDLPPYKNGVAPGFEVLLEPDEEKFCKNYHTLFNNQSDDLDLRKLFSPDQQFPMLT